MAKRRPPKRSNPALPGDRLTWEGGALPLSGLLEDLPDGTPAPEGTVPWLFLWVERETRLVVGVAATAGEDVPGELAELLVNAMRAPMAGPPRRPGEVVVGDPAVARVVRERLRGTGVEVRAGELEVWQGAAEMALEGLAEMADELTAPDLTGGEGMAEMGAAFFRAAAEFYRAAPWRVLEDEPIALRLPGRSDPVYATVMGSGGMEYGLALHFSADELARVYGGAALVPDALAVTFDHEREVPPPLRAERKRRRWPLAGPAAFPFPMRTAPPGSMRDPDAGELALLTAALDAVREFSTRFGAEIRRQRALNEEIRVPGAGPEPVAVGIEWPVRLPQTGAETGMLGELHRLEEELGIGPTEVGEGGNTPLLSEMDDRVRDLPGSAAAVRRLVWSFFRAPWPGYAEDDVDEDQAYSRFHEWVLYFSPIPPEGRTLAERALAAADDLTPEERAERGRFVHPLYGVWKVVRVEKGKGVELRHVEDGSRFRVRERMGSYQLRKNAFLCGPLFQVAGGEWVMGTMTLLPPVKGRPPWKRLAEIPQAAVAVELEEALHGAGVGWVDEMETRAEVKEVWDRLRDDLGGQLYTWAHLERRIRETNDPRELAGALLQRVEWWTQTEVQVCTGLLMAAWNVTTRPELGGRSPLQARDEEVGPEEERLLGEMIDHALRAVAAKRPASAQEAEETARARMRSWLTTPRRELGGRTPLAAIEEERRERGTLDSWEGVEGIVSRLRLAPG